MYTCNVNILNKSIRNRERYIIFYFSCGIRYIVAQSTNLIKSVIVGNRPVENNSVLTEEVSGNKMKTLQDYVNVSVVQVFLMQALMLPEIMLGLVGY
ncbi:hypothetical protein JCM30204_01400 [Dysgonomonas termitidis]